MTDSYRTMKTRFQALRRMRRDAEGTLIYPTVIARRPRPGDVHALPKSWFIDNLRCIPPEYLHGLRRIELLPRESGEIGRPFGAYFVSEKRIALYSLPRTWEMQLSDGWREHLSSFGSIIDVVDGPVVKVRWPRDTLKYWFWFGVLMHELGHHYVFQYKHKHGRVRRESSHEALADLHAKRYLRALTKRQRELECPA